MKKNMKIIVMTIICSMILSIVGCGCKVIADGEYVGTYVLYKIGDNSITIEVNQENVKDYINDSYTWSIEPTVLMYTADGRTSWIQESEVEQYKTVGWSTQPPVVIYSAIEERNVLVEEVDDYLSTGVWFMTISEARPVMVTMNAFTKTNFTPRQLETILSKGLSGYGQAFYDMEQKYGINSIFAISVAELESGNGTSYAFRTKNNAFGIGPGMSFNSVESGIEYFGKLINKSLYYGKSIDGIGSIYCVGGNWAGKVKSLMCENYAGLGY